MKDTPSPATTCYACELPASTKEHAPPRSFFPVNKRDSLTTVPSCAQHNNDNSRDVEYVRNVITTMLGINEEGLKMFNGPTSRSLGRSTGLRVSTFGSMHTLQVGDMLTGALTVDLNRVNSVMIACTTALHFANTSQKHSQWAVVSPNLLFREGVPEQGRSTWQALVERLQNIDYEDRESPNPEIFKYATAVDGGRYVYRLLFFGGFCVFAFSI
jgi:hypothetical protein